MDRVTREAIDERLRVLEGVSGAVFRCIEDLMRVRSALPAAVSPTPTPTTSTSSTTTSPATDAGDQHSAPAANDTLDAAISSAREAVENDLKVEEVLNNEVTEPAVGDVTDSQPASSSSTPQPIP